MTRRRKGAALLEFAIVLPIMVIMLLLMIDIGRALLVRAVVQDGTFAAAWAAATNGNVDGARNRVNEALAMMPLASNVSTEVTVRTGSAAGGSAGASGNQCTTQRPYVYASAVASVPLFTPVLGYILGGGGQYTMHVDSVARCAVGR